VKLPRQWPSRERLTEHPEEERLFGSAVLGKAKVHIPAILSAYDFSASRQVADIGGAHGHLIRAFLQHTPNARGILFDQPDVVEAAQTGGFPNPFRHHPPPTRSRSPPAPSIAFRSADNSATIDGAARGARPASARSGVR
jgi:hypothetical protein